MDPVPGMERLALVRFDQDRTVHLLHSLFSFLVGPYSTDMILLAFNRELPSEGLPPVMELLYDAFAVRCAIFAVSLVDHHVYVEGIPLPCWKSMSCERAVKLQ